MDLIWKQIDSGNLMQTHMFRKPFYEDVSLKIIVDLCSPKEKKVAKCINITCYR
jgi:hypothetical protein